MSNNSCHDPQRLMLALLPGCNIMTEVYEWVMAWDVKTTATHPLAVVILRSLPL